MCNDSYCLQNSLGKERKLFFLFIEQTTLKEKKSSIQKKECSPRKEKIFSRFFVSIFF
jgi:hypothetical protein